MKKFVYLIPLLLLLGVVFALNKKFEGIPRLGMFLSPYTGFWQNAEGKGSYKDLKLKIPELKDEVNIVFDERMVPHIYAQNEHDLYIAQGYVTARLRLFQMEMIWRAASGSLSEIVGEKTLEMDRYNRRNGMGYAAEKLIDAIESDSVAKEMVNAYGIGVNAYISQLKPANYPLEYKLLDFAPTKWEVINTAYLLKHMAYMLTALEDDIENTNNLKLIGEADFEALFRDYWPEQEPIVQKGTVFDFTRQDSIQTADSIALTSFNNIYYDNKPDGIIGSNNWAVSGSKTVTKKPILCNDPHLQLNLPSIWVEMHLNCPSMNVRGVSLPGAPAVIIGFNDYIAWGVTNAGRDVRDWYKIEFVDGQKNSYYQDGIKKYATKRIEEIKVKGQESFFDTVIYTHQGPVVYDENFRANNSTQNLALRWTAHDPSNEFLTFYELNQAKNLDDYLDALKNFTCPGQNFVFASKSGDIAIQEQGKFPIKPKNFGKFVLDGNSSKNDISGYIPFDENPRMINPARGYVFSANQQPTDTLYPYYYNGMFEYFRSRRINDLLSAMKSIGIKDMEMMQQDNYSYIAATSLPIMLQQTDKSQLNGREVEIYNTLRTWDFQYSVNSKEASFFEEWFTQFYSLLWDEFDSKDNDLISPEDITTIHFITDSTGLPFKYFDIKATPQVETKQDILLKSFKLMAAKFKDNDIEWANFKHTHIDHLTRLPALSRNFVNVGGNLNIINATNATHGPSWRMVVSLEDKINAFGIIPGGQSGNPGSRFYDNEIDDWAQGKYYPLDAPNNLNNIENKLFTIKLNK